MLIPTLLLAATVSLSPETPLGTPSLQAAGGNQTLGSVASNGHDFLAAWDDQREPLGTWVGHVDTTGTPVEPAGHPLGSSGLVTWSGSSYLYVNATTAQPLDENGRPVSGPIPLHLTVTPTEVASNGITILALSPTGLNVLGFDGRLLADQGYQHVGVSTPMVLPTNDYAFVTINGQCDPAPCSTPVALAVVDGETGAVRYTPLSDIGSLAVDVNATSTPDGSILIAWVEHNGVASGARYEIVDANGHTIVPPVFITTSASEYLQSPVAGWDGNEFLVLIESNPPSGKSPTLRGYRINASGQLLDTDGFVLTSTYWQHARIAHAANAVLVAWDESNGVDIDVVGRAATSFDDIERADDHVLAMSAQAELRPRLAEGGAFAIWREPTINGEVHEQPIGGREDIVTNSIANGAPTVARGKSEYLVVWIALDPKAFGATVNARRVAFDGSIIDPQPIILGRTGTSIDFADVPPPAAAFDGTNFFVVWPVDYDLQGMRVSESGALLDAAPIAVSNIGPHSGAPISPRVVWDGTQYVVGWIDSMFLNVLISPVPPLPDFIRFTRVTSAGTVLDPASVAVWNLGDAEGLSLAANADGVTAMWAGYPDTAFKQICLWAVQLRRDGTVRTPARELFCNAATSPTTIENVDVAWSGSEFVAVWHDAVASDIKAQRFGASLLPLDPQPFEVSPSGARAMQPSIASSPAGTAIAYVRVANEPQFAGVPRVFVRTLARIGAGWPRAAKH